MKLLYVSLLTYVFISTIALSLSGQKLPILIYDSKETEKRIFAPLPELKGEVSFPIVSAQAALAYDLDSGVTLYEKDPDKPLLPASTTKIVTALVALDHYPLDAVLEVLEPSVEGQKMGLIKGEKIRVTDLLYGLLIYSANDAAEALAQNFPAGAEAFVMSMNKKAGELSLEDSYFTNPTGLDGDGLVSTARDLVRVSTVAMSDARFAKIVGTKQIVVKSADGKIVHRLTNINKLLGTVAGVSGVKTGWTENARENLVTYVERNGRKVMIALLGSSDRFGETKELIDWIFANYTWSEVAPPVTLHSTRARLLVHRL